LSLDIADNIQRHGFKRLLLAVSGGLDSICLAHYFVKNREALGIEWLGIAHVHHGLREGAADRDAAFVETFAKSLGVPFFLKKLDGMALKSAEGSLEENAREARYRALFDTAVENFGTRSFASLRMTDKGAIVTAHHAGDQAETLYMRIRRGTTLAGLRGMQEVREIQCEMWNVECEITHLTPHISHYIYRPFLNVTREELLTYARENNLTWCEDESNSDVKFARNKIRHQLLPHLERECPGTVKQLCRIAGLADRAYEKVVEVCEALFAPTLMDPILSLRSRTSTRLQDDANTITLDKKKLRKVLVTHENADLSEVFRLWLAAQGLRFPIGFFYDSKEPAHVKIPHHAVYRKRAICKIGHMVQIREFCAPEEAQKFVSCGSVKKCVEKDNNEPS
jgi:tRNA(Ile)-lysidine synthase